MSLIYFIEYNFFFDI